MKDDVVEALLEGKELKRGGHRVVQYRAGTAYIDINRVTSQELRDLAHVKDDVRYKHKVREIS